MEHFELCTSLLGMLARVGFTIPSRWRLKDPQRYVDEPLIHWGSVPKKRSEIGP